MPSTYSDRLPRLRRIASAFAFLLDMAVAVRADDPPTAPMLRIETGVHTAAVDAISVDAANRFAVTGSEDKTVRVWDLKSGLLLRTIRPPIGPDFEGQLYAVAISPDGATIACAGTTGSSWDGSSSIYLFDRASGKMVGRIKEVSDGIIYLAYSYDGKYLEAATYDGVRIYRTADGFLADRDSSYGDACLGMDLDSTGRLVACSWDGYLRLYNANFAVIAKVKAPHGSQPCSACFSPDGTQVAVGFNDSDKVDVVSGRDLSYLYSPDTKGLENKNVWSVAWSPDGAFLFAGLASAKVIEHCPIRRWSLGGQGPYTDFQAANDSITGLEALKGGGVVWSSGEPAWGTVSADGVASHFGSPFGHASDESKEFLISGDGGTVQFGFLPFGTEPERFNSSRRVLVTSVSPDSSLRMPITSAPGIAITDWRNNEHPQLNGRPVELSVHEVSHSLASAPDGKCFLLGTGSALNCFDRTGKQVWSSLTPGTAWAVNIAGNGKVAAAHCGDGTIRWFRMSDGQELLAFYLHPDRKRWVLWTLSGYYDCSPGGEEIFGWQVNRGRDAAADFYPAPRFRATYYRPDVVGRMLTGFDEATALHKANAARKQ